MAVIDWLIVVAYLAAMLGLSAWLGRGQRNDRDYFLAGNSLGPLPVALSTMATQCSTNSLLGAPAVVAFGAGLLWLQFELALPLAMIVLLLFFFPVFRRLRLISLYEFLELRFGTGTRLTVSAVFQFLRAFSTGVTLYGVGQVLVVCLDIPFWLAVLLLGAVTVVYDILGGMKAVVWSDVIQLVFMAGAMVAALWLAVSLAGGWESVLASTAGDRWQTFDFQGHGLGDGSDYGFWPVLIGGFFLYIAYYGCDQTQAQRELATRDINATRKALLLDGLLRFPFVLVYCLFGIALAAYVTKFPEFLENQTLWENGELNYNRVVPAFVLGHFPPVAIGFVVAALFAAAMSSLDSTLNSLSALTVEDWLKRFLPDRTASSIGVSRLVTAFWGIVCLASAFVAGDIAPTIIEAVNKVGSFLNGPLLGLFTVGLLMRKIGQTHALTGFVLGLAINAWCWLQHPEFSWLWWNVFGWVVAVGTAWLLQITTQCQSTITTQANDALPYWQKSDSGGGKAFLYAGILALYTAILSGILAVIGIIGRPL
jgi:SSS family transporter